MKFEFVLAGQPVTKKNSLRAFGGVVLPSKAYKAYENTCRLQLATMTLPRFTGQIQLTCHYWLKSRRIPDLIGLLQATSDILQDERKRQDGHYITVQEWLYPDDNAIVSYDGSRICGVDRENPRVEIQICDDFDSNGRNLTGV